MKRIYILFLLLLFTQFGFAQVGIGTTDPDPNYALDVNGSVLVQDEFKTDQFSDGTITTNESRFLVRRSNSNPPGEVAILDLTTLNVGPINIADYSFTAPLNSGLIDVNLQYDSTKYIVGLSNFRYAGSSTAVQKGGKTYDKIGNFRTRTYIDDNDNQWHIQIGNPNLATGAGTGIVYYVTIIIYDRNYFKELSLITKDLKGARIGDAVAPQILQ